MISTLAKRSRWLWSAVFGVLLITAAASGTSGSATWANPPHGTPTPETRPAHIEPFSFQLAGLPGGIVAPVAHASIHPQAAGDWSELAASGFEEAFENEGWEVQGTGWARSSTQTNSGSYSAAVEAFDGAPSTRLIYGGETGFSLAGQVNARLDFAYWLDTKEDVFFGWAASADGQNFYGARTCGRVQAWLSGSLDLTHLLNDDSVWIAFTISGDGSGAAQNVFLDDVAIMTQEPHLVYLPLAFKNYTPPFPDFHDDFSNTSSGWPRVHVDQLPNYEEHRNYSNEYGTCYKMKLGGWTWFHRVFASPEDVFVTDDFTLQTNIMYDLGDHRAEWGFIFEANDNMNSYYMVSLYIYHPYVYYRIRRQTPSEGEVELVPSLPAPSYLIRSKGEWNTIRVVRDGNKISFYARNPGSGQWELVKSAHNAPPLSGDRVGYTIFNSELGADAWFDNFHLWQEPLYP